MENKIAYIEHIDDGWYIYLKDKTEIRLSHTDVLRLSDHFYGAKSLKYSKRNKTLDTPE